MWKYGKDIIRHLFEKRGYRPTIRVVLESKGQALSDRSDIRVFEAGLSSERYGDNEQGTGNAAQDAESKRLIVHAQDVIYEHLIHNILFPLTRYNFIGISEDIDGVRIILQQQYFSRKFSNPSQKEIDDYLIYGLGLRLENKYFYANDYVAITDVSANGDNVLNDNGKLYFIDPIIKFKKPAVETLNYYYDKIN